MKVLVVYDSFFGNTEQIARAVGRALETQEDVTISRVGEVNPEQLKEASLVIVGSPTRAFRPSEGTQALLKQLAAGALQGVKVAAFDTRISVQDTNSAILRFFVKLFGYAAEPIAAGLKKKGGELVIPPEGFIVKDTEGPLKEGELERATRWADTIRQQIPQVA